MPDQKTSGMKRRHMLGRAGWALASASVASRAAEAAETDAAALTSTLIAVLLGVGFYAGFVAKHELETVARQVHQLLAASLAQAPSDGSDVAHTSI